MRRVIALLALAFCWIDARAQQSPELQRHAIPAAAVTGTEPSDPPARTVQDTRSHVRFDLPPGWNLARRDGELSTFSLDARSAPPNAEVRAVAALAYNPFPRSTFSGALFYLSLTPHSTPAACLAQAHAKPNEPLSSVSVGDVPFARGHDAHGTICTEARDTVYTTLRHGSCVRFDLAINSFCGGEVSGARDLTDAELADIQQRLESLLAQVQLSAQ
jgi:hypothetical protein